MDPIDLAIDELRTIVETASRSSQKVFVLTLLSIREFRDFRNVR